MRREGSREGEWNIDIFLPLSLPKGVLKCIRMSFSHLQCKICKRRIANTAQLRIHMETHEEPKFKCSFCGKMLKTAENLEYHEREHRGEKPFK